MKYKKLGPTHNEALEIAIKPVMKYQKLGPTNNEALEIVIKPVMNIESWTNQK